MNEPKAGPLASCAVTAALAVAAWTVVITIVYIALDVIR